MTSSIPPSDAAAQTRRITTLSVWVAVVLIALKAFAMGASGSISILASLADSSLDLVASLATFFAVRWAAASPDTEHRFGHGKGEAMAALVQAGLVFASAVFIGWEAIHRIFVPRPVTGGVWAVAVVLISLAVTGWLVWRQGKALKSTGSLAVAGDRAHYAADMASGVVILIGVASGAFLQAPGLDAAAGLVVVIWLFWGAIGILRGAADHLLDRGAPDIDLVTITTAVLKDARVSGVHQLRTRMSGTATMIQMHIDLDPTLTLDAAHAIVVEAEDRVKAAVPGSDVLIHADPRGRIERHPVTAVPQTTARAAVLASKDRKGPWS